MTHYVDDKPHHYLTARECRSLNIPLTREDNSVGTFSSIYKKYKRYPIFDKKTYVQNLPLFQSNAVPVGFMTKKRILELGPFSPNKKEAAGMFFDPHGRGLIGVYDLRDEPSLLSYFQELEQFHHEIETGKYEVFTHKNKPPHLVPIFKMSKYFLDPDKAPSGIYLANSNKAHYLYDLSDEYEKPHFSIGEKPDGFYSLNELEEIGLPFDVNEPPAAYFLYTGRRVVPLYDRRNHPKVRLRLLTSDL